MKIEKNVKFLNCKEPFKVVYVEEEYQKTDSTVVIYDKYKISVLLTEGLGAVVNNSIIETSRNGILFFRPDEIHFGRFFREGIHKYIDFYIPTKFFNNFCKNNDFLVFLTDISANRINYIELDAQNQRLMSDFLKKIVFALQKKAENTDMELFSLLLNIVFLCNEFYDEQKENHVNSNIPDIVKRTLEYIFENYNQKLSLEQLSKNANCSIAYLCRTFKKYTQMTIYQYIVNIRINNAKIMLENGETVTNACYFSGFEDCSNFISTFKKIVGITPFKYKNQQKEHFH